MSLLFWVKLYLNFVIHNLIASCLLPSAFCFLPSAFCFLPSALCFPLTVTHTFFYDAII